MNNPIKIKIMTDFSKYPAGRNIRDGPFSGEKFRKDCLKPILDDGDHAIIDFDGARGYGSSFLEEAFGGLIRTGHSYEQIQKSFEFVSSDESIIFEIRCYLNDANRAAASN